MIRFYTVSNRRPDFIVLQSESLKKYVKEDFEYIVVNNATNWWDDFSIRKTCLEIKIKLFDAPKDKSSAVRPINFLMQNVIGKETVADLSVVMDSDIFLISEFDFKSYISGYDVAGIYQQRQEREIEYLWIALVIINHTSCLDWRKLSFTSLPGTDAGGASHKFLQEYSPRVRWMKHTPNIEDEEKSILVPELLKFYKSEFGSQIIENAFFHYYRGSNWDRQSPNLHKQKTLFLKNLIRNFSSRKILVDNAVSFYHDRAHAFKHWNGIVNNRRVE